MKILIVRTSSLGDILHCFPALAYLRQKFPNAKIDWVAEASCAALVKSHPFIDDVIVIDTKKGSWRQVFKSLRQSLQDPYDLVIDWQGNCKSAAVLWHVKSSIKVGFDRNYVPEWPNLLFTTHRYPILPGKNIRTDYLSLVQNHFQDATKFDGPFVPLQVEEKENERLEKFLATLPRPLFLLAAGAHWPNKKASQETLLQLLQKRKGYFLLLWGSEQEKKEAQELHQQCPTFSCVLEEKFSLPALQQ